MMTATNVQNRINTKGKQKQQQQKNQELTKARVEFGRSSKRGMAEKEN